MARTVTDAAILLGAMAGPRPARCRHDRRRHRRHEDYTRFLDAGALRGARIGVARNYFGFHEKVDALMEAAFEAMRAAGAEIVDDLELDLSETRGKSYEVLLYEFKHGLNAYLADAAHGSRHRRSPS